MMESYRQLLDGDQPVYRIDQQQNILGIVQGMKRILSNPDSVLLEIK
jgi:hypothetical protein